MLSVCANILSTEGKVFRSLRHRTSYAHLAVSIVSSRRDTRPKATLSIKLSFRSLRFKLVTNAEEFSPQCTYPVFLELLKGQ